VVLSLGAIVQRVENPAPAQEPKRPEPTIPYSWRSSQPPINFEYVTDCDRANELLAVLEPCTLGFDVEWKPAFLKGQPENKVALIQLANNEVIYLLQVSAMQSKSQLLSTRPHAWAKRVVQVFRRTSKWCLRVKHIPRQGLEYRVGTVGCDLAHDFNLY